MNSAISTAATMTLASTIAAVAGGPEFNIVKPSTTGIPGEECRLMAFDPEGNLWVGGRWSFWGEGGLARLPASELPYSPLPAGGFDTGLWTVWSNVFHPIPSPYLSDITFAPDGIVWLASDGGLTRFDPDAPTPAEMWFTWNAANSPLIMDAVRSIDLDSQGNVWLTNVSVQTSNGAVFRFSPASGQWTQYTVGQQLPWSPPWLNVDSVLVGSDDRVYVTHSVLQGFAEFDGASWTYHGGGSQFDGMLEDFAGNIWFTTGPSGAGVWKWNGSTYASWLGLGGTSTVTGLGIGLDGTVYVSTWYGDIFKMIGGTTPVFFVDADNIPRSVYQRPGGDIWINNYGGNGTLGTVRHYTSSGLLLERINTFNSGLPWYFIDNIQTDNDGNLWFACGEGGLSRMLGSNGAADAPTRWRNWGNHNDLSEPYPFAGNEPMYSMYEHPDGTIYMGGNGIARWDPATGQFLDFWNWQNSNLGVDSFIAIEQDGNGDLWIASDYTGIYKLVEDDWQQHLFGVPFTTANWVNDMVRDTDGNLWVATQTSLHFFNGTNWFSVGPIHGSPVELPQRLAADTAGGIWIGASNGLIHYADAQWQVYDPTNSPMPATWVQGLDVRADGLLGMAVADFGPITPFPNGVVLFDGTDWQVYTYGTDPLPHYQLGDVEFDADGDLWVSTTSEGVTEIVLGTPALPADFDGDGDVDVTDFLLLLGSWGPCPGGPGCTGDVNGDGSVDVVDLLLLLASWT